ncbi:efflux RND transporter periplasmic adaptor subunit [Qipengyuania sp. DY56-A-20]|jgi:HlyD family secretion protein|uniref:Efflux RND transporter periplasmic adaptor subunit n=1 Tax=Qipengyuania benthica TaxID=3067651 RepID=A0ABT9H9G4_9SPHN|nr:efflux RND transporter periplasmic adaptor subunit [Qipengyuania sp. DY56-A-20]MDP4539958.1 efflux RND transporter periplasmic adaptor subunit [Qipengyuania sp. DY56-A-20]
MSDTSPAAESGELDAFLGEKPRPRWRRWMKFWLPALILLILVLMVSRCFGGDEAPGYITEEVVLRSLDLTVTATGNLRPTNQVQVGSEVSGRIDRVLVDVNDRVVPGQVLAEINTDVIEDQITQARANLNAARAQVEQARATLEVDRAQLARFREVFEISGGRVPSQVELEQAQAAVRRGSAAVASAQASVRAAEAQLSSAVTNRNRAVVRSPVAGIVLARQVEPGQTVAASFSTPTLFIIAEDLSEMQLQVAIDEADVGQVEEGQQASFTVDAYPGRRFPAVVERVDQASSNTASEASQQANPSARANAVVSYEARLAVNNPQGLLRPGMTATATIATQSTGRRMLVPNSALRFRPEDAEQDEGGGVLNPSIGLEQNEQRATIGVGSRQQVYVPQADGTLEAIEVVTGQSDGRLTVVRSDALKAGMEVVTGIEADAP